jgi:Na+/phosphate symporter
MSLTILIPLAIAFLGALIYVFVSNPKAKELGRLLFLAGMMATCFAFQGATTSLGWTK